MPSGKTSWSPKSNSPGPTMFKQPENEGYFQKTSDHHLPEDSLPFDYLELETGGLKFWWNTQPLEIGLEFVAHDKVRRKIIAILPLFEKWPEPLCGVYAKVTWEVL